jgi:DNA primase
MAKYRMPLPAGAHPTQVAAVAARSTIASYSLRATLFPGVSAPVTWDEVEVAAAGRSEVLRFGPRDVLERVAAAGDLFRLPP